MPPRLPCLLLLALVACSSSSEPSPPPADAGADSAAPGPDLAPLPADAPAVTPDAPAVTPDAPAADAATAAADSATAADAQVVQASEACRKFCDCMAKNCADKTFPGGCLPDCASHPKWDLACRMVMCVLVPDQPNNDHCTHAMGMYQCLDKP